MSSVENLDEFSQRIVEGTYSTSELDVRRVLEVLKDSKKALDIAQRKGTRGRNALHNALIRGKCASAIVTRLAEVCPEGLKVSSDSGLFPIHRAIAKNATVGTIKSLLALCPECASQTIEKNGFLPVHSICGTTSRPDKERILIVEELLKCHPSCLSVWDKNGNLPIHLSAKQYVRHIYPSTNTMCAPRPEWDFFEFIVKKLPASVRCKDPRGSLPVHLWLQYQGSSSGPLTKLLFDEYPESLSQKDESGFVPVHQVAQNCSVEDFKYLVEKYPEYLGLKDAEGNYPIHTLLLKEQLYYGHLPHTLKGILNSHPALLRQEDAFGRLPIHLAARQKDSGACLLIQTMGELFPGSLFHKDKDGNIPIHLANDSSIVTLARMCPESLRVEVGKDSPELPMVTWLRKNRLPKCRLEVVQEVLKAQHSQPSDEAVQRENRELKDRLEVKEKLVNTLKKDKESLQDEIKDMKVHLDCELQTAEHARGFEKAFIAQLRDSQNDIPTLKSFAAMLKARLDARASAKEESSANKPSLLHRMFPSLVRDPEVSRSVLIDCVEAFDAELTVLETEEGDGDECSNAITSATEGNTQAQEHWAASELPNQQGEESGEAVTILAEEQVHRPAKRARVSLP